MMNVGVSIFAASFLFLFFFVVKVVVVVVLKDSKKKTGDDDDDEDKGKEVVAKCTHFLNFSNDVGQKYRRLRKKRRRRRRRRERRTHLIVHVRDVFVAVDIVEPFLAIFFQTFELL